MKFSTRHYLLSLLALSEVKAFGLSGFAGPMARPAACTPAAIGPMPKMCAAHGKIGGKQGPRFAIPQELGAMAIPTAGYAGLGTVIYGATRVMLPAAGFGMTAGLLTYTVGLPVLLTLGQVAYFGGPGVAKAMGGKESSDPRLVRLAQEAAEAVGVKAPYVYEVPSREPNAFATSGLTSKDTTVAVTTGIREVLTDNELKAVLAHEMGHLKYSDVVRNMHIAAAGAGLGGLYETGRMLLRSSDSKGSRKKKDKDEDSGASLGFTLMIAGLTTEAAAHLLRMSVSRGAEFRADRAAAEAFGADTMISALKKIHNSAKVRPADLREKKSAGFTANGFSGSKLQHAMISDGPTAGVDKEKKNGFFRTLDKIGNALRTHPTLDKRVAALEMAVEKGLVPKRLPAEDASWFWNQAEDVYRGGKKPPSQKVEYYKYKGGEKESRNLGGPQ